MRSLKRTIIFAIALAVVSAIVPAAANAQLRNQNKYSKRDVNGIIRRLENSSDTFRRDFARNLNNSNINGTQLEDEYNGYVMDYENQLDQLRRNFDRTDRWWETREDVGEVIRAAGPVNQMISRLPFARNVERQWRQMRNDLNTLANTYDLPGIGGGGWGGGDGGGGGGGGNATRPPTWAQGTFYANGPRGEQIMLSIDVGGGASSVINGSTSYGYYRNGILTFGADQARVERNGTGIRTVSTSNGETIFYTRNGSGGGGGWDPGTGSGTRPPSWAQGTFYGNGPRGERITLAINANGNATSSVDGSTNYGTYRGGILTFGPDTARVERDNNGIRTVSTLNGETIYYTRNTWGDGGGGGGTWNPGNGNPPSWAVGSFRGTNPQNGQEIYMNVSSNGNVTVSMGGAPSYGRMDGSMLTMGSSTARVYRDGNGFRTVSTQDGQTIYYRRN